MMSNVYKAICTLSSAKGSKPAMQMSPSAQAGMEPSNEPARNGTSSAPLSLGSRGLGFMGHYDFGDTSAMYFMSDCGWVGRGRK